MPRTSDLVPAPTVLVQAADPYKLQAFLDREHARRAIIIAHEKVMVAPGVWAAEVYQLRRPRPAWAVPAAVGGGVTVTIGLLGALAWWLASVVTAATVAFPISVLAGGAALGGVLLLARLHDRGARRGQLDVHIRYRP